MSPALEDYLETIYLLVQEHGFARVKDIANARSVKASTISIALRKLAEEDLVRYERREYITLTAKGAEAARRILSRHRLLTRFFESVLKMSPDAASEQACSMEHSLTNEAMDRMVQFFEFLGHCTEVVRAFDRCPIGIRTDQGTAIAGTGGPCSKCAGNAEPSRMSVTDMKPGQSAIATQIAATGAARQRILDMGILPETTLTLESTGTRGEPLWIRCQGARLALRHNEAAAIRVRKVA
jgi:DtxR family transcriptional regulator, Mn-dependent transcriptional regulator